MSKETGTEIMVQKVRMEVEITSSNLAPHAGSDEMRELVRELVATRKAYQAAEPEGGRLAEEARVAYNAAMMRLLEVDAIGQEG